MSPVSGALNFLTFSVYLWLGLEAIAPLIPFLIRHCDTAIQLSRSLLSSDQEMLWKMSHVTAFDRIVEFWLKLFVSLFIIFIYLPTTFNIQTNISFNFFHCFICRSTDWFRHRPNDPIAGNEPTRLTRQIYIFILSSFFLVFIFFLMEAQN